MLSVLLLLNLDICLDFNNSASLVVIVVVSVINVDAPEVNTGH